MIALRLILLCVFIGLSLRCAFTTQHPVTITPNLTVRVETSKGESIDGARVTFYRGYEQEQTFLATDGWLRVLIPSAAVPVWVEFPGYSHSSRYCLVNTECSFVLFQLSRVNE